MSLYTRNFNDIFRENGIQLVVEESTELDLISQLVNDELEYSEKVEMLLSYIPEVEVLQTDAKYKTIAELFKHSQFVAFRNKQQQSALEKSQQAIASSSINSSNNNSISIESTDSIKLEDKELHPGGEIYYPQLKSSSSNGTSESYKFSDIKSMNKHDSIDLNDSFTALASSLVDKVEVSENPAEARSVSVWHKLPSDISHRILGFLLDPDMCGYLVQIAKTNPFIPRKLLYKEICEFIYPRQSPTGLIFKEGRNWRDTLINKPRLRTNGWYFLRTIYSKAPCNDNFWEDKKREFIEMRMYRHMRFFLDGHVLYSLNVKEPWDFPNDICPGAPVFKDIYEGRYVITGRDITVDIFLHYGIVQFKLRLKNGDDGYIGNHNMLTLYEHSCLDLLREDKTLYDRTYGYLQASNKAYTLMSGNSIDMSFGNNNVRGEFLSNIIERYKLLEAGGNIRRCFYNLPGYCDMRFFRNWDFNCTYNPK